MEKGKIEFENESEKFIEADKSKIKSKLATIALLGQMFAGSMYDRLIDRGFLYCLPCGAERKVEESGDVEQCAACGDAAYNLHKRGF